MQWSSPAATLSSRCRQLTELTLDKDNTVTVQVSMSPHRPISTGQLTPAYRNMRALGDRLERRRQLDNIDEAQICATNGGERHRYLEEIDEHQERTWCRIKDTEWERESQEQKQKWEEQQARLRLTKPLPTLPRHSARSSMLDSRPPTRERLEQTQQRLRKEQVHQARAQTSLPVQGVQALHEQKAREQARLEKRRERDRLIEVSREAAQDRSLAARIDGLGEIEIKPDSPVSPAHLGPSDIGEQSADAPNNDLPEREPDSADLHWEKYWAEKADEVDQAQEHHRRRRRPRDVTQTSRSNLSHLCGAIGAWAKPKIKRCKHRARMMSLARS